MPKKVVVNVDDVIASALSVIGGLGVWPRFLRAMKEEHGISEAEIELAFAEFGKRVGRSL